MVADALIYHPAVTHYNKFVATTTGRDKALRTVQYFSRFLAWYLYRTNHSSSSVATFSALKSNLGVVRKAMRIGKFVEHFKAAATAADAKALDPIVRWTTVGRQLGYAFYMSFDTFSYLDAAGVKPNATMKRLAKEAYRAWMTGLLFSLVQGVYGLYRIRGQKREIQATDAEKAVEVKKLEREQYAAKVQLFSDLCDLSIPTSALGYVKLDDGLVGLLGTVSSLLGVYSQWAKTA